MPDDKRANREEFCLAKSLSIEDAFSWTQSFVAREWRLLLPVALAFLALPPLMMDLLVPQSVWQALALAIQSQNPQAASGAMQVVMPVMGVVLLIASFGGLTISAMALIPVISVVEALSLALRRLPTMLGALLLVAAGQVLAAMVLTLIFAAAHLVGAGAQSLLVLTVMGLTLFVTIRLIGLSPIIVTRRISVISAIRESWHISQGAFWRILGVILIYCLGATVVMLAFDYAVGILLNLAMHSLGADELGRAVTAVVQRTVGAMMALGLHLLIAAVFRQLNDAPIRGI